MTDDDKLLLAYIAGAVTVAVVLPLLGVAALRYVPPLRNAARESIANLLDAKVAGARAQLPPELRVVETSVATIIQTATREPIAVTIHNKLSVPVADAALNAVAGPPA